MKILICSNAPWAKTGYGTQTASLARRMRDDGHNVAIYCNYGLNAGQLSWEGITCFPTGWDGGYIDNIVHGHIRSFQPDLVFTFFDLWPVRAQEFPLPMNSKYPSPRWAAWFPVDHEPLSPATKEVLPRVTYPVTYSRHGHEQVTESGFKNTYIPHGIEKDFYYTTAGRAEMRRVWEIPKGSFVFGSVGLNRNYPSRKGFDRLMKAFAEMPENAYLYLHTMPESQVGSMDLRPIAEMYGIKDRVIYPDKYNYTMGYSQAGMNAIYSAIDCYVQPTHGEGFGLPVLEAQACGCPVIATDCTSMPELCNPNSSMLIKAEPYVVPDFAHRFLIDVDELKSAMTQSMDIYFNDEIGYRSMRANAGKWSNNWDWDELYETLWKPFLAEVQRDIDRAPRKKWHRGEALVFEHEDRMRKQDSTLRSPAVAKELAFLEEYKHEGIIPVVASGEAEDGTTYFDMPLYRSLRDIDPDDLYEEQKQRILDGVSGTLNYLHDKGVAHRDVAPENVVVDDAGNPYLIDFAWAHACDRKPCVDFEPWKVMEKAVPIVQVGGAERGYHTIVKYLKGIDLKDAHATGLPGVPYQALDGTGERDCSLRWDIMKPDVMGKRVLDVGCNLGYFANRSLEEGAEYALGIDHDAPTIEAAGKLHPNVDFSVGDISNGGLPQEHFDVAFLLSVLQHVPNPDQLLESVVNISDVAYVEIPPRFVTDGMATILKDAPMIGESERGRPIYKVERA